MVSQDHLKEQIYGSKKRLANALKSLERDDSVLRENRKLLLEFSEHERNRGLSPHRISIMLINMKRVARLLDKSFKKAAREDLEKALGTIVASERYSDWTKDTNKAFVKLFYRWLYRLDKGDSDPPMVRWITRSRPPSRLMAEDLLTIGDIKRMYSACNNVKLRALVSVLYEGALRPGELLRMQVEDVIFNKEYVKINVRGKMQKSQGDRTVYIFNSYDPLKEWLEEHPLAKADKSAPVWINGRDIKYNGRLIRKSGEAIPHHLLSKIIRRIAEKAGIEKEVFPYLFRHSRGTELYKQIGEAMAKKYMGHSPDSRMARVYLHLNDQDILDNMLQNYGMKKEEEKKDDRNICSQCGHPNAYTAEICSACRSPLKEPDIAKAINFEEQEVSSEEYEQIKGIKELLTNPKVLKVLREAANTRF